MKPRGVTLRVRRDPDPQRTKPWGVWWNEYRPGRTRPHQKSQWFATEAEAEAFKRLTLAALATETAPIATVFPRPANSLAALAGNHPDPAKLTGWLRQVQEQREAATLQNYRDCVKNYLAPAYGHARYPALGDLLVADDTLTTKVVVEYLRELHAAGVGLAMRRRVHRALSAFCSYARFLGLLTRNPCSEVGRMIRQRGEVAGECPPNPFTPAEIATIFDQIRAVEDLPVLAYCTWQYHVGTRPGEAAGLQWTALDLDRRRAEIRRSYSPAAGADKDPKTHERRWVDLTDQVIELLLEWRPQQREAAFCRGLPQPLYVFTTRRSAHHTRELARFKQDGNLEKIVARVFAACRITGHTLYDFRDSFATSHLVPSWDRKLAWVSKQLGHKTPLTTAKHYYAFRDTAETRGFANEIGRWR